uniref:Uncharacterized protein n=1 Tax=Ceratitis capitata TaxID=7213 RepID=W8BYU8_CERCA
MQSTCIIIVHFSSFSFLSMLTVIVARVNNRYKISKQMLLATQSTTKSRQSATKVVNNTLQLAGVDRNMLSTVFVDLSARTSHYLAEKYRTGCYECACLAAGAMNWREAPKPAITAAVG